MNVKCQGGDWAGDLSDCADVTGEHMLERLFPEDPAPYGECPKCGNFCYRDVPEHASLKALMAGENGITEKPELELSPVAQMIFGNVKDSMQDAEELGGPEGMDYVALMANITREALLRARTYADAWTSTYPAGDPV